MTLDDLYRLLCSGHVQTQGIVDTIQSPLVVLDGDLRIAGGNKAFFNAFQLDAEAATGMSVFALGNGQWNIPELRHLLDDIIPKSSAIVGYELSGELPGRGQRNLPINARRLAHPDNNSPNLLLEIEVPFVLASAQDPEHLGQEDVLTGAVNVGKPVDAQALTRQLRALLAA